MAGPLSDLNGFFCLLLFVVTLGPLLFGYHLAELNAPSSVLTCEVKETSSQFLSALPECIPMSTAQFGLVSSIFTIGGLVGALCAGPAAAKYGRLPSMRYTTIFFILGPLAEACSGNVATLAIGRFLSGIGAGASVVVAPLYVSEVSPPKARGLFGAFTQVMVNVGILMAQLLGLFLSHYRLWRIILGVGGIIGLNQLAGLLFAVESPQWAADNGRVITAKRDLQRIRGHGYDIQKEIEFWDSEPTGQQGEGEALLENPAIPTIPRRKSVKLETVGIVGVLLHPHYRQATFAVMVVFVAQQLCGINSIVMYGVSLLSDLLAQSSALLNVVVAAINLVVTIACAPLVDKLGRRKCLLLSICGMGTSALVLGFAILEHIPILSAISVLTFVGSFGVGLGPIPFLLSSELVGPEAVGATQSWSLAANWISTFLVAQFFPLVNEALGKGKAYFIFAGLAAGFATFVYFKVPETKGKTSVEEVWGREAESIE